MTILAAVPESREGRQALAAAAEEAKAWGTDLVVVNLGLRKLREADLPDGVEAKLVERSSPGEDPADLVLDYLREHPSVSRLVIGVKRRTPVGKALLGSISQRLLLEAPVPVLAVKLPERGGGEGRPTRPSEQ